ncbi:MAG: 3-oxoacyl-[acyl-carrier-protein] reductase [Verrucomicrobia bacterium]|nr:3-oxoacyl-[acyl-carrier-protein] reductase [Verrucomicrobiota bacterium]MCH8510191.1 3-oxoacyl-[acyl-carrier-protein] reductase [Kiritimatiellia bacterium]
MALLEGKVAVVTGAARGIGQSIALRLAEEGADLALCDVQAEWLTETKEKVEALGRRAEAYGVDVSKGDQVQAGVAAMAKDFGHIDIVVNNAGITRDGLLIRMSEEDWDLVMNINLKGTFLMTKAAAKVMMKQRSGVFVNISSVIGLMGNPGQANYGASKAAVSNLTKTAAKELAARGIRANAIAPGFIKTKMTDALSEDVRNQMLAVIPMKDFGTPEDVANVVLFLASDLSRYVTGQTLSVCGGMVTA